MDQIKVMIVALARKLLIAHWWFVIDGVVPQGATLKPAAEQSARSAGALRDLTVLPDAALQTA